MKKIVFSFILSFVVFGAFAQTDSVQTEILTKEKIIKSIGLYIEPTAQYGQINNTFTPFLSGSGMIIFNQKLAFGFSGASVYYLSNTTTSHFKAMYGGLKTEYSIKPTKTIHFSIPLVVGGIQSNLQNNTDFRPTDRTPPTGFEDNGNFDPSNRPERRDGENHPPRGGNDFDDFNFKSSRLFVQPGINVELSVIKFLKVYLGANYRFAIGQIDANNSNSLLNGASVQAGLKIGYFDFKIK